jgi:hypothetical protein
MDGRQIVDFFLAKKGKNSNTIPNSSISFLISLSYN